VNLVDRLRSVCPQVLTDSAALARHSSLDRWTMAGSVSFPPVVAIARPATAPEVAAVLAVCSGCGVPVTPVGGRSGVCGGAIPVHGGVVLDLRGLTGPSVVDDVSLLADVRAGVFGHLLEEELRVDHGLALGHRPQSVAISTVGGWLACRSAGQYSTRYGKIEDMVVGLEVALADGSLVRTGGNARAATGPDLTQLFVGSEGTLGIITEARLRLHPLPSAERRSAWAFPSFAAGLDACRRVLRRGSRPAVLRLYDPAESKQSFGHVDNVLVVLDEGDPASVDAAMETVAEECRAAGAEVLGTEPVERWMVHRDDVPDSEAYARLGIVGDTLELAGRWSVLGALYEDLRRGIADVAGTVWTSAHLSHAYADGACLYVTFAGQGGVDWYVRAWDVAAAIVLRHEGTLSHHHGIGLAKARFLPTALGAAHGVLCDLKRVLDPAGVLNPGKLGLPDPFGEPGWPAA